jgi:citronellol/citronellal dehydrogenase
MNSLQDRVAIITGSSRGIGRALALGLARAGCRVVIAAKSTSSTERLPGSVYSVAEEVAALGSEALPLPLDVRDADQIESLAARTLERFGRIDVLINNAGALWWQPLLDTPAKRFDLVMSVNARAAFLCSRAVLPAMIERRWGHVININWTLLDNWRTTRGPLEKRRLPHETLFFFWLPGRLFLRPIQPPRSGQG